MEHLRWSAAEFDQQISGLEQIAAQERAAGKVSSPAAELWSEFIAPLGGPFLAQLKDAVDSQNEAGAKTVEAIRDQLSETKAAYQDLEQAHEQIIAQVSSMVAESPPSQ